MKIKCVELADKEYGKIFVAELYNGNKTVNAIIAIHDTTLGRAVGGTRIWDYTSFEEALKDVKRLAKGMTYKSAAYKLASGGGKAVIICKQEDKSILLFRQFGQFINQVNDLHPKGYVTGEDVGISTRDLRIVKRMAPKYVGGLPDNPENDHIDLVSPVTAYGQFRGSQACLEAFFGSPDLSDKIIAIQGVGKVGYALAELYYKAGAQLIISDMNPANAERARIDFKAEIAKTDEILYQTCDILAPCALGAIINDKTIPLLNCEIVAGSANNQLDEERHGKMLMERGILYAPDYVINAGGLLTILGVSKEEIGNRIYRKLKEVFEFSKEKKKPTNTIANELCDKYIDYMKKQNA